MTNGNLQVVDIYQQIHINMQTINKCYFFKMVWSIKAYIPQQYKKMIKEPNYLP